VFINKCLLHKNVLISAEVNLVPEKENIQLVG